MARFVQRFFGLTAPDASLRRSVQFAPVQIIVSLAAFAFAFGVPHALSGWHLVLLIAMPVVLSLLFVEYILKSRELARRDHAYRESHLVR